MVSVCSRRTVKRRSFELSFQIFICKFCKFFKCFVNFVNILSMHLVHSTTQEDRSRDWNFVNILSMHLVHSTTQGGRSRDRNLNLNLSSSQRLRPVGLLTFSASTIN